MNSQYETQISQTVEACNGFSSPDCTRAIIALFLDSLWMRMSDAPTARNLHNGTASARVLLSVPPYGVTTGHYDNGWNMHSVLNKDAKPQWWMHLPSEPKNPFLKETV